MRQNFHFTPSKGWINDPNGVIFINGEYHLFYQHYPHGIEWGPMHWGHGVSRDLVNWTHKPIALYPDDLGYIFSGSCIYDEKNISGLGNECQPPLIAFYTSHNPKTGEQQQSIAYSTDFESFKKYEGNPVIANVKGGSGYKVDFRDPKVFENPVLGGFGMVLAAGEILEFYHSVNLLDWEKTGEFDPGQNGYVGICECPDCMRFEIDGEEKWVLSLSSIFTGVEEGRNAHVMQYFVGDFDGYTFTDMYKYEEPLLMDYGPDNYAQVSFANISPPLMIGWGEHWDYAAKVPAEDYRGKMTLARSCTLVNTEAGYRLKFEPVGDVPMEKISMYPGQQMVINVPGESEAKTEVSDCDESQLIEHIKEASQLVITVTEDTLYVDRSRSRNLSFSDCFKNDDYIKFSAGRILSGPCEMTIIQDQGYFEIFGDGGLIPFSIMVY